MKFLCNNSVINAPLPNVRIDYKTGIYVKKKKESLKQNYLPSIDMLKQESFKENKVYLVDVVL